MAPAWFSMSLLLDGATAKHSGCSSSSSELLVLFHKEVLCFDSSLNRIEVRTGQGSSLVVNVGECWKGDYRWLAWAEDTKGASCCLTLKGWGERMFRGKF